MSENGDVRINRLLNEGDLASAAATRAVIDAASLRAPFSRVTTGPLAAVASDPAPEMTWPLRWTQESAGAPPPPPTPIANFTWTPAAGPTPLLVTFTNTSSRVTPPVTWLWEFNWNGTGWLTFSTLQDPVAVFTSVGTYDVRLTVTAANGVDTHTVLGAFEVEVPALDTALLMHFTSWPPIDSSAYNREVTTFATGSTPGNAVEPDTTIKKFSDASLRGSANAGYVWANLAGQSLSAPWCIDFQWYVEPSGAGLFLNPFRIEHTDTGSSDSKLFCIIQQSGNQILVIWDDYMDSLNVPSAGLSVSTWHHIAITFDGTTLRVFVDGVLKGSKVTTRFAGLTAGNISLYANGDNVTAARLDEFRVVKEAVWTASFTPPSAPYAPAETTPLTDRWSPANGTTSFPYVPARIAFSSSPYRSALRNAVSAGFDASCMGVDSKASGKWYREFIYKTPAAPNAIRVGLARSIWSPGATRMGEDTNSFGVARGGVMRYNATWSTGTTPTFVDGDRLMIAIDVDTGNVWFGRNGTWAEGDPGAGTGASFNIGTGSSWFAAIDFGDENTGAEIPTTQSYSLPSGFSAWI